MSNIRDWYFMRSDYTIVKPVEVEKTRDTRLFGKVYNDKRFNPLTGEFQNGHRVITSPIVSINWETGKVITESGSEYILDGDANSVYIEYLLGPIPEVNTN